MPAHCATGSTPSNLPSWPSPSSSPTKLQGAQRLALPLVREVRSNATRPAIFSGRNRLPARRGQEGSIMFSVTLDILIALENCPENGLEAVDWRRKNQLPEAPTRDVRLTWASEREENLCRQFSPLLNQEANLIVQTKPTSYSNKEFSFDSHRDLLASDRERRTLYDSHVSADLARPFLRGDATASDVAALLESLLGQAAKARAKFDREKQEREDKARADKEAAQAEHARREAEKEAARQQELVERKAWAEQHGSTRLRRLLAEEIECTAVYRDERLAHDRPGWLWYQQVPGQIKGEPRNVAESAFETLDLSRQTDPSAKLAYYLVSEETDDETGNVISPEWRGCVATAEFLGETIIFGLPAEVVEA